MKSLAPAELVLILVGTTLCVLAIMFALASIQSPEFRGGGVAIAGTILGALTTMATIIIGATYARSLDIRRNSSNGNERRDDQPRT